MTLGRAVTGGVIGGATGAALMLPVFAMAKQIGILRPMPPTRVVAHAAETAATATELGGSRQDADGATTISSHLLYGTAAGALYGLLQDETDISPVIGGPSYGVLLWATGYLGWIPAAGILPWPWRQQPGAVAVPLLAHLVYGLTLGFTHQWVRRVW
jgi:hypothetical protein